MKTSLFWVFYEQAHQMTQLTEAHDVIRNLSGNNLTGEFPEFFLDMPSISHL